MKERVQEGKQMPKKINASPLQRISDAVTVKGAHWIWSGYVNDAGIPMLNVSGQPQSVRRIVAQEAGPLPNGSFATARCGVTGCVAPGCVHLVTRAQITKKLWKTGKKKAGLPTVVASRKLALVRGWAKLDAVKAAQIRALHGLVPRAELARRYGVSVSTIARTLRGEVWLGPVTGGSVFTWRPAA